MLSVVAFLPLITVFLLQVIPIYQLEPLDLLVTWLWYTGILGISFLGTILLYRTEKGHQKYWLILPGIYLVALFIAGTWVTYIESYLLFANMLITFYALVVLSVLFNGWFLLPVYFLPQVPKISRVFGIIFTICCTYGFIALYAAITYIVYPNTIQHEILNNTSFTLYLVSSLLAGAALLYAAYRPRDAE